MQSATLARVKVARFHQYFLLLVLACCGCKAGGSSRTNVASCPCPPPLEAHAIVDRAPETNPSPNHSGTEVQQVSLKLPLPEELPSPEKLQDGTSESLPLLDAVSLALAQNPDLVALRQTERVGVAAVGVADTYPFNPFLQVQATPWQDLPGSAESGRTSHYVLLMQRIQLAHQQGHREDVAMSSLNGIRWSIYQMELQTASTTAQLYFTLLYQRGLRDIAKASQDNNQLLLDSTIKRFEAGDVSAADVATVRYDTRATLQQLQLAEANYQTAVRDLMRQLGASPTATYRFAGDLTKIHWRLPGSGLVGCNVTGAPLKCAPSSADMETDPKRWAATRPDVLAARANIAVARANYNLATANRIPDLNIGPYYQQNHDGMTLFGFRADTNLPIIDTGRPMQRQRSAELTQQSVTWRQVQLRAELEAEAAYERYEVALQALQLQSDDDRADLPQELQALERQFHAGEVDVVRAIQARTSILQNQLARLNLMNEAAQSAALLVGATGMPFELIITQEQ